MRKFLVIYLPILLLSIVAQGQTFSLKELELINSMEVIDFHDYFINKGFSFSNVDSTYKTINYHFKIPGSDPKMVKGYASVYYSTDTKDMHRGVSWETTNKDDYLLIKGQLKQQGFKNVKTEVENDKIIFTFRKGNIVVIIYSDTTVDTYNRKIAHYEIVVENRDH